MVQRGKATGLGAPQHLPGASHVTGTTRAARGVLKPADNTPPCSTANPSLSSWTGVYTGCLTASLPHNRNPFHLCFYPSSPTNRRVIPFPTASSLRRIRRSIWKRSLKHKTRVTFCSAPNPRRVFSVTSLKTGRPASEVLPQC